MRFVLLCSFRSLSSGSEQGVWINNNVPYLFEISIAQRIPKVPSHTEQNDVGLEMTPFERMLALVAH